MNHEYIDLGLPSGLKWATCNIGANAPEEVGDYFAWGEIKPKDKYTEENSLTYTKNIATSKNRLWNISGKPKYDAATANWGKEWRMPTKDEMLELVKRGDLCGMSFAYTTDEEDSENAVSYEREGDKDGKEVWLRHVKRIDNVYDVTVAASPAYEDTEISQRELFEAHLPKAEAEQQREKEAQDKATVMKMRAKYYNTFNY